MSEAVLKCKKLMNFLDLGGTKALQHRYVDVLMMIASPDARPIRLRTLLTVPSR